MNNLVRTSGVWLPANDTHMAGELTPSTDGRATYQLEKLRAACAEVRRFGLAIDVGAHVGLWSMQLALFFDRVLAFEPVAIHCKCFKRNLAWADNVTLHRMALGKRTRNVRMRLSTNGNSGETMVAIKGETGTVAPMRRLDDMVSDRVDFIKLDCEGYEAFVMRGGEAIIKRDRPVVIIEQHDPHAARYGLRSRSGRRWLITQGYREAAVFGNDFVMVPVDG